MSHKIMKILILEDEIPAYQKLVSYLNDFFKKEIFIDWSRSVEDGKSFLKNESYDIILSDIKLLDGTSFDLFNEIIVKCPIIFCSAYNDYLFQAFKTNGIAYILKPYTENDFRIALEKHHSLFLQGKYNALESSTLNELKAVFQEEKTHYKKRFVIKRSKGIQLLNIIDISVIEASGDFCIAIDYEGKRHTISQNIGALKEQLDPEKFFKINRSQIIHIDYIENIENYFKNRLLITTKGSKSKVMTSSSMTSEFRKWLDQQ